MSHSANSSSGKSVSLVWLRRDLRLHDHAALARALNHPEAVQPVFIFDTDILARFTHRDDRRLTFITRALCAMHNELARQDGGILVLLGRAQELLPRLCRTLKASRLIAAGDSEPAALLRDEHVKQQLEGHIDFIRVKDHVIFCPDEILKDDGTALRVFTPYSKRWRGRLTADSFREHSTAGLRPARFSETFEQARKDGLPVINLNAGVEAVQSQIGYELTESAWHPDKAADALRDFTTHQLTHYKERRDFPGVMGTSRLSPYLRFGILSVRQCARAAAALEAQGNVGAYTWMNELIWREFFSMILAHFPHTVTREFQEQYVGLHWRHDAELFQQFAKGRTGYPIVDAAMRELLQTGFMHNRARMIVASFMTKDLLLDWRLGEEHFAQYLMDYDQASNVGGWQWAASTGTDAQPYFRIFNPVLQSRKFDPEGEYIRRFLPELAHLSGRDIHEPWISARPAGYPAPIVDHSLAKEKVLALFKAKPGAT